MSVPAWIAVGLLGGLAAGARFLIDFEIGLRARGPFPIGILAVNLSAALALGIAAGATLHGDLLVIVAGGGIGSFSTFSTWILDSHRLGSAGLPQVAWLNIALSILLGFAAVSLGHLIGTQL